jgi:Helicase conserved C-terminal domain
MNDAVEVRDHIVRTLRRDLIGPSPIDTDILEEVLPARPSRWYLTGYLVPRDAPEDQREGTGATEGEITSGEGADGTDDAAELDPGTGQTTFLPSSIGLSVLVPANATRIKVLVSWGDYRAEKAVVEGPAGDDPASAEGDGAKGQEGSRPATTEAESAGVGRVPRGRHTVWRRTPGVATLDLTLPRGLEETAIKGTGGLRLAMLCRNVTLPTADGPVPACAVSVFFINSRTPRADRFRADEAFVFQAALELHCEEGFVPRQDPRGLASTDPDEALADLHYRDINELAVGHNVAATWDGTKDGKHLLVHSVWQPTALVPRVDPNRTVTCELRMDRLGALPDADAATVALAPLTALYRDWIEDQAEHVGDLSAKRQAVARQLLANAGLAAQRIDEGIACLADPLVLDAFCVANRAIATTSRRRNKIPDPTWYPFQLAFLLLNLPGIANREHPDRETVDLLFFPTGGGKTEAYLGLSAFTIALRRLRTPGPDGAGLTVLMRYTLRLLTLDQLGRAAAVVCALELERQNDPTRLGEWPIEIALWVGSAATPNRMGSNGEPDPMRRTARTKVLDFAGGNPRSQPVPINTCPWCATPFTKQSFRLWPNSHRPSRLDIYCVDPKRTCEFHTSKNNPLPLQAVDEPIYRRLPAFMIATVDKFAAMPWTGELASFFGGADRHDGNGFYGPTLPGIGTPLPAPLAPPDLVIQDELHLISGPLGTMVGLYEAALDSLCCRAVGEKTIRPKIVASTATVRSAPGQIRALFDRDRVQIFPPPARDRTDSFFAKSRMQNDPTGRLYLGIAAPGGSPKVVFLRCLVTLMSAAQYAWNSSGAPTTTNPGDGYMTLLSYFNALRELGGARRIVEGEVSPRLEKYGTHLRLGETDGGLASRTIKFIPVELTSRVSTQEVAEAKEALAQGFDNQRARVDVALATNMISVGLDITRLSLMVVSGQPKTAAEYIQATSRVGRNPIRPGLVVVLLNMSKPRDRSHFERFRNWHEAFYRAVEATSVTPWSARAMDRGLAAVTVGLARLGTPELTPQQRAGLVASKRPSLDRVAKTLSSRASRHSGNAPDANLEAQVYNRSVGLLDDWTRIASDIVNGGGSLGYDARNVTQPLLREMLDPDIPRLSAQRRRFRAPRSLRDTEPSVFVKILTPDGSDADGGRGL